MIIRIVDIGSNSVKASLYAVQGGQHRLLKRDKLDYSVGNAVFPQGSIPESGLQKIATFVKSGLSSKIRPAERPHFTFVLATSAVRSARNRDAFVARLSAETGIGVRVLSGAEESFLIHGGILSHAAPRPGEVVKTIDIGGGSAEVSWSRDGQYLFGRSYELGAIRLTRKFMGEGKAITRTDLQRVTDHALELFRAGSPAAAPAADRAIGSSGNVRAIAHMAAKVRGQTFSRLLPVITPGTLEDIVELSIGRTPAALAAAFDLPAARAPIIMPAVMVLLASLRHFGIPRLEIADSGLREGAAAFWSRNGHLNLPVMEDHEATKESAVRKSDKAEKPGKALKAVGVTKGHKAGKLVKEHKTKKSKSRRHRASR
jgi:exopolyphosphatase/guanosine-5'-triphosphate,3'-diphosphate pyrophosphatase